MFEAGKKPREQLRMPQEAYIQIDQWMNYLGYEQYCWWRKFISWVNRQPSRIYEFHVPYTLESVYKDYLKVSKAHFYKKIKVLWECGLIELVEFDKTNRKTTKPRNIIVYDYPFNDARFEYLPLEKRRDWATEYESEAKKHGYKGVLKAQEIKGLQMETVELPVDNSVDNLIVDNVDKGEIEGLQMETVEGLQMETVTVSKQRPNHYSNNLVIPLNNSNHDSNNSLSQARIDLIREILISYQFSAGERERIVELLIHKGLYSSVTKVDLISQAKYMGGRTDIRDRATFFVNGIEKNIGREYPKPRKQEPANPTRSVPFYNWLEN